MLMPMMRRERRAVPTESERAMTVHTPTGNHQVDRPRRRLSEVAFVAFGATVFGAGLLAVTTYCVTCVYPATVTGLG